MGLDAGSSIWYHPFLQALHDETCKVHSRATTPGPLIFPSKENDAAIAQAPPTPLPVLNAYGEGVLAQPHNQKSGQMMASPSRGQYPYYEQQEHGPRNRRECDDFNRFHFGRLSISRGKCGLAPKVGEEPLTVREVEYVRQVAQNRSQSPRQACSCWRS
jgi:hypothetical protein